MIRFIQVSTTVNDRRVADRVAKILLKKRLSSCVQIIGPIASSYWWKGKIERITEWLCLVKARSDDYPEIESAIKKIHPYQVPEVLALPILNGNPDYLRWIRTETKRPRRQIPRQSTKRRN